MTTKAEWGRAFTPDTFDRSIETLDRVVAYCMQDCRTEAAASTVLGPLSPYERRVWELDQKINQRGVRVDVPFVEAAMKIVADATGPLTREFEELTGGLGVGQVEKIRDWCEGHGVVLTSLDKPTLAALGIGEDDDVPMAGAVSTLPAPVRRALEIRSWLGSSSIKKLPRMLATLGRDGRCRGLLQYHGAHTGLWSGRLWQPQNLPRGAVTIDDKPPDPVELAGAILTGDAAYVAALYGNPIAAVAAGLRGAIIPADGHHLAVGDFAGIQMRIVLALAGQYDKCDLLAAGHDVYLDMACDIYRVPRGSLTKKDVEKRQIGKNTVLGCGFQMGKDKFHQRYCSDQLIDFAEDAINAYRKVWAPKVPALWEGLGNAALKAVVDRSQTEAYGIVYEWVTEKDAWNVRNWLACHLPDGQTMWYYDPHVTQRGMPWDQTDVRMGWAFLAKELGVWKRVHAYGGVLTQNVVSKIARGLLVEAMFRCEAAGYPVVLNVHDEIVAEPKAGHADAKAFQDLMAQPTPYSRAIRVPIAVEEFISDRYHK